MSVIKLKKFDKELGLSQVKDLVYFQGEQNIGSYKVNVWKSKGKFLPHEEVIIYIFLKRVWLKNVLKFILNFKCF
jgi:hypothetical protein